MSSMGSTLKSVSYGSYMGVEEIPDILLEILAGKEDMKVNGEYIYDYSIEIIEAALNGKIVLDGSFNLIGFVRTIQKNKKLVEYKVARKCTYFKPEGAEDDKGGVVENHISEDKNEYNSVDVQLDAVWAASQIIKHNDELVDDLGVNLINLLKKAKMGFPQAIERLRDNVNENPRIAEWVLLLLESGQDLDVLLP
ncbi:hypothetical protein [[Clostridium] fimetarium]|uniref:Uncharacterized protein n=1 Tax=[Clostridium] fimetarium TaxID=99656 RepID=A0A1I0RDS0_9FIRM|nr:hypothetical protein [[Clostridium] fimetarium]SEW38973.1 hypothetical protein SAMN05421659_11472 [[Clostridium] fimetarium]